MSVSRRQGTCHTLTKDEQRCLVLCDLAHSVWEKMKDDVDMAWPTFESVYGQLNESTVRERHDFRSVQMCLLSTYALEVPVLVGKSSEGNTDVVFLAIACLGGRRLIKAVTGPFVRSIQRDLLRHVEQGARVVVCGEHTGALFAQRLTVDLLRELKDSARYRVSCVSVGSNCDLWLESPEQFLSVRRSFTSLRASVHLVRLDADREQAEIDAAAPQLVSKLYRRVGSHFTVKIEDGNIHRLQQLNEGDLPTTTSNVTQQWEEVRTGFSTNLQFYLAVSVAPAKTTAAELPCSDAYVPSQVEACVLCGEMCGLFHISDTGRQVDGVTLDVLQRALEYACNPISRRLVLQRGEYSYLLERADQAEEWLRENSIFKLLERLADLTKEKDHEKSGKAFRRLIAECLSRSAVAKTVIDERVKAFLTRIMDTLTSALKVKPKSLMKRVLQVDPAYASSSSVAGVGGLLAAAEGTAAAQATISATTTAASSGILAKMSVALGISSAATAPTLTVGGIVTASAAAAAPFVLATTAAAGLVTAGVHLRNRSVEKRKSIEERYNRYQATLRLFLDATPEDSRWLCLSASQLESLLMEKVRTDIPVHDLSQVGVAKVFSEITEDSFAAACLRIDMAKTIQQLRRSLMQTWYIALFGALNAGKSTMLKEIWQREDISDIGLRVHTTNVGIYTITQKVKVIDFPGLTGIDQSVRKVFHRHSAMVDIIIYLAQYNGRLNMDQVRQYQHVREFAGDAPILVCLTKVSCHWEDDDSLHSDEKNSSFRHKMARLLGCAVENLLLTEVKRRSEKMVEYGVAGCEEIRQWLKKQLVRMEIYKDSDEELDLAVGHTLS